MSAPRTLHLGPLSCLLALTAPTGQAQSQIWTRSGDSQSDRFGLCVSAGDDFNGDGVPDVVVGDPSDRTMGSNAGAMFALSGADGSILWRVDAAEAGDSLGFQVAGIGDVDGDGIGDAIGGARFSDAAGPRRGEVIVVSGATGLPIYSVTGDRSDARFGEAVASAGDVNGDGVADFIVGARYDDTVGQTTGAARVYSGVDGSMLHEIFGDSASDYFGNGVGSAGDLDGDGLDDFLVGAPRDDDNGAASGSLRAYSGATGAMLWRADGDSSNDTLGGKVAPAGDVNLDGVPDVVVGILGSDLGGDDFGAARVLSGADGSVIRTYVGTSEDGQFGSAVWGGGDLDGDGYPDVVVGARLDVIGGDELGSATAFSGFDGSLLFRVEGPSDGSQFGDSLVTIGDLNGDGFDDLAVGAFGDELVRAYSGRDTIGTIACGPAVVNSSGASARILAEGSPVAQENVVTLAVTGLPVGVFGLFATSTEQNSVVVPPGSVGRLCIASSLIGRYGSDILTSGPDGTVSLGIDLTAVPLPVGTTSVLAGETRYWQYWFRDVPTSNFSDAVGITFE